MFNFDNGVLFVLAAKDLVITLRNMADLEKGTETAKLVPVEIQNLAGTHKGVAFHSAGHPTVLYFEEKKAPEEQIKEAEAPKAEEKVEENVQAEANPAN